MYEKTLSAETVYRGLILEVDRLEVELSDGRQSVREIVRHGVAVAIIPRLPDGRLVFVRQFRKAVEQVCFEVVAGNCDPGEAEETAAARELREETGYRPDALTLLGPIYPSVGYCTERIDVYYADISEQGETAPDEDEHIETVHMTEAEMDEMIRSGNVTDAKTLAAWMLYKVRDGV